MTKPWHSMVVRANLAVAGALVALVAFAVSAGTHSGNEIEARNRAIVLMGSSLFLIWSVGISALLWHFRDPIKSVFVKLPGNTWVKFFFFCLLLLMIEEVVTTTLTNCAPLFGSKIGVAYITGSSNYLEVILWHSVIALFPAYIAWALVLRQVSLHPNLVYLLYGLQGCLGEVLYGGLQQFLQTCFWVSVYGTMIYLPAFCIFGKGECKPFKLRHYLLILVLSMLLTAPSGIFVHFLRPSSAGFPEVLQKDRKSGKTAMSPIRIKHHPEGTIMRCESEKAEQTGMG